MKPFGKARPGSGEAQTTAPRRTIYLVAHSGNPNFGDEVTLRTWLRHLARTQPDADVWVDTPFPGPTATLLHTEHPRLRTTDTLFRLCADAPSDVPSEVADFVELALKEPGEAPRWIAGIEVVKSADVVHLVGGSFVNARWRRNLGIVAALGWLGRQTPARTAATGQALMPSGAAEAEVWMRHGGAIDVLTVRDEPSLELVRGCAPHARLEAPDLFLHGLGPLVAPDAAQAPDTMVCVGGDVYEGDFSRVVERVRETLAPWKGPWRTVGFVECMPRVDRAVFDALQAEFPDSVFYPLSQVLRTGMPARAGQRWVSSRFHAHAIAAAAGASGVALVLDDDYYGVSHRAAAATSGWTVAGVEGERPDAGRPAGKADTAAVQETLQRTARAIYGV